MEQFHTCEKAIMYYVIAGYSLLTERTETSYAQMSHDMIYELECSGGVSPQHSLFRVVFKENLYFSNGRGLTWAIDHGDQALFILPTFMVNTYGTLRSGVYSEHFYTTDGEFMYVACHSNGVVSFEFRPRLDSRIISRITNLQRKKPH